MRAPIVRHSRAHSLDARTSHTRLRKKLGSRRFGAEEAPKKPGHRWAVSRQAIEPGQRGPPSQPETRVPLRPDAIDRKVRSADRAPPPLCTETPVAERAPTAFGVNRVSLSRHARQDDHRDLHSFPTRRSSDLKWLRRSTLCSSRWRNQLRRRTLCSSRWRNQLRRSQMCLQRRRK